MISDHRDQNGDYCHIDGSLLPPLEQDAMEALSEAEELLKHLDDGDQPVWPDMKVLAVAQCRATMALALALMSHAATMGAVASR